MWLICCSGKVLICSSTHRRNSWCLQTCPKQRLPTQQESKHLRASALMTVVSWEWPPIGATGPLGTCASTSTPSSLELLESNMPTCSWLLLPKFALPLLAMANKSGVNPSPRLHSIKLSSLAFTQLCHSCRNDPAPKPQLAVPTSVTEDVMKNEGASCGPKDHASSC